MQLHQIRTNLFTSHKSHMLNSWLNSMHIRVVLNANDMTDKRNFNTSKDVLSFVLLHARYITS